MLASYPPSPNRRIVAIAAMLALHMVLFAGFQLSRQASAPVTAARYEPYELVLIPLREPKPAPPKPAEKTPDKVTPRAAAIPALGPPPVAAPQPVTEPEPITEPVAIAAPLEPSKSADEIMRQARRDVGKIDKDLQKAYPGGPIKAPPNTPHIRMVKGMELAHDMAPPGLFEAPKITEIIDPGQYGRKRYRVVTARGTYCLTYESVSSPGQDHFRLNNSAQAKRSNCPPDEQPATTQKW